MVGEAFNAKQSDAEQNIKKLIDSCHERGIVEFAIDGDLVIRVVDLEVLHAMRMTGAVDAAQNLDAILVNYQSRIQNQHKSLDRLIKERDEVSAALIDHASSSEGSVETLVKIKDILS